MCICAGEAGGEAGGEAVRAWRQKGCGPVGARRVADAVHRDRDARVRRLHLVLLLAFVADDLDVAVAGLQAGLVATEDEVRHDLAGTGKGKGGLVVRAAVRSLGNLARGNLARGGGAGGGQRYAPKSETVWRQARVVLTQELVGSLHVLWHGSKWRE